MSTTKFQDIPMYGTGRRREFDPKSLRYSAASLIPKELPDVPYAWWPTGPTMNQGPTSQCVPYSGTLVLRSEPVKNKYNDIDIHTLYLLCLELDEWEDN